MRLKKESYKINVSNVEGLGMLRSVTLYVLCYLRSGMLLKNLRRQKCQSYQNSYQFNVTGR